MGRGDISIILSTHIVGDISSTCHNMALLDRGRVVFRGSPDELVGKARGKAWKIRALEAELDEIKASFPVISTVPADDGWEVHVVSDDTGKWPGEQIEPNLEHAYVYFMERTEEN
jgi:ABC-type multidrug transport system ATPase subunit